MTRRQKILEHQRNIATTVNRRAARSYSRRLNRLKSSLAEHSKTLNRDEKGIWRSSMDHVPPPQRSGCGGCRKAREALKAAKEKAAGNK